eukprot:7495049-Prorocentrum_lima.AAC.1
MRLQELNDRLEAGGWPDGSRARLFTLASEACSFVPAVLSGWFCVGPKYTSTKGEIASASAPGLSLIHI